MGLEIPCDVIITMLGTINNQLILEKWKKLLCEKYAEPKEKVIIGSFSNQMSLRRLVHQQFKINKK